MDDTTFFDEDKSVQDNIADMSQGNPGALEAMMSMMESDKERGILALHTLDRMNMYGSRIWIAYKDYCDKDVEKFLDSIFNQDEEMVDLINEYQNNEQPPVKTVDRL